MSLGSLIRVSKPVSPVSAMETASARTKVNRGDSANVIAGRSRTENHKPKYGADSQRRPYWPRPFVWLSAKTTKPSAAPRSKAFHARSLVDSVSATTTISFPIPQPCSPRRSSSAINRSLASDMRQLERQIDCRRRVSQRADRNIIDAGRGDAPHVLQVNPAARLEFYFPFSSRDGLPHLARLHVIEQNHVDAFDLQMRTDLIKPIGLDFDFYPGTFLAQPLDRVDESGKATARAEVIVFDQYHVAQGRAMVRAAAGNNRCLFQRPQARRGFAGIENFRRRFPDRLDKLASQR